MRQHGVAVSFVLGGRGRPEEAKDFRLRYFISSNYHKMKHATLIVLLLALSISCFAVGKKKREKLDSWLNSSKHSLIVSWGPPAKTTSDGDGGEILIYQQYRGYAYGYQCYINTMFYVNKNGTVYHWAVQKENDPVNQLLIR